MNVGTRCQAKMNLFHLKSWYVAKDIVEALSYFTDVLFEKQHVTISTDVNLDP